MRSADGISMVNLKPRNRSKAQSSKRHALFVISLLSFLNFSSFLGPAFSAPLEFFHDQKISDTAGGFTGVLATQHVFGYEVSFLGDLDGDGIVDLAVGALQDDAVWILLLNADGTVKSHQKIAQGQGGFTGIVTGTSFSRVKSIGDVDGDGVIDIAVGAPNDNPGSVWILFLNTNGTVKSHQYISSSMFGGVFKFGWEVARLGDLDGDTVPDIAVGAHRQGPGTVWILFLNSNGTVKSHQQITEGVGGFTGILGTSDHFGYSLSSADFDGDTVPDLAVGANFDEDGGAQRGAAWILLLNTDGTVKSNQKISDLQGGFTGTLDDGDLFGAAVAWLGDVDADGVDDLAVGAIKDDDTGTDHGAVWILLLNSGGTVKSHEKIVDGALGFTGPFPSSWEENFGISIDLADVNLDGLLDLAIGTGGDNDGGPQHGALWILFSGDATEIVCDGIDDNGNDIADEDCDEDEDDFCNELLVVIGTPPICPSGGGDCLDSDPNINPGSIEICDGVNNNCDPATDDGCDDDADDYCDENMTTVGTPPVCPNGGDDCNDFNPLVYPGASEICDFVDNQCPGDSGYGQLDEGYDTDGDGWTSCENDCIEDGVVTDEACPQGNHGHQPDVPYGGDPVNLANGNFTDSWTDLAMPGPGIGFAFVRTYNSRHAADDPNSPLGFGWTHSYHMKLEALPSGSYNVLFGDGHKEVFTPDGLGGYTPHGGVPNVLTDNGDGTFSLLRRSDRLRFDFDTSARLAAIVDKNGNTVQCLYTAGLLTSVIDDAGRTVTFAYDGSNRIITMTDPLPSPDTRTVHYTYDGAGDLVSVQDVRANTTSFTYDAEHQMLTLTDPRGNLVVSNTYDGLNRVVSYQQDFFGNSTSYVYDKPLGKTTVTDPLTHVTVFWYDEDGHTLRVDDPLGYELSYVYKPSGEKESMTDKTGQTTAFTWDYRGNMLTRADPDGAVTRFTYNSEDRVIEKEDPLGNSTHYTYDANGNLETTVDRLSETETRTYTPKGLLETLTDRRDKLWSYQYDPEGNLTKEIDPLLNETVHDNDDVGRRSSTLDPELNLTQFGYDEAGHLTTVTDALGRQTVYEYDENGNRTKRTDAVATPKERETRWQYDEKNRLVKVIDPELNETEYGYDANDRKTSMIDPRDYTWSYEYDGMGNLTKVIDPLLRETRYEYDGLGRRTSRFDPANSETIYTYDPMGRLLTVEDPLGNVTERTYYLSGHLETLTDPLDRTTTYEYDAEQRRTAIEDAMEGRSEFEYDEEGHRTKLVNANVHETLYTYDDAGRLETEKDPLLNTWTYTYDGVGNRIKRTDPDLLETDYSYDALNRLDGITYPDVSTVSYVYDEVGNRTSMTDSHGTVGYVYDDNDRLTQVTDAYGRVVSYSYDAAGNRTSITYPGSLTVSYTYDEVGRLETVGDWQPGGTATYAYTLAGDLDTVTYPNGAVEDLDYDTARRLTSIVHDDGIGGTIASYAITLDAAGQRTAIDAVQPLSGTLADLAESYTYNLGEEILSRGAWAYTHDTLGNLTGATSLSSTLGYQYDYDSRMVGVNRDGVTDQYGYDADGARFLAVRGGVETRYLLDRAAPMVSSLAEIDSVETVTRYDVHGHRLLWSLDGSGDRFVYHTDPIGSVVAVTDDIAAVVAAYAYDAFGALIAEGGAYDNDNRFVGSLGVTEEPSGLTFMRARYYDPGIGRFNAVDPAESIDSRSLWANPYVYAAASPIFAIDPTGLFWNPFDAVFDKIDEWDPVTKAFDAADQFFEPAATTLGQGMKQVFDTIDETKPVDKTLDAAAESFEPLLEVGSKLALKYEFARSSVLPQWIGLVLPFWTFTKTYFETHTDPRDPALRQILIRADAAQMAVLDSYMPYAVVGTWAFDRLLGIPPASAAELPAQLPPVEKNGVVFVEQRTTTPGVDVKPKGGGQ